MEGRARISVTLFAMHQCQCKRHVRQVVAKCQSVHTVASEHPGLRPISHADKSQQKSGYGLAMPVYRLVDCIDLLPRSQCRILESAPYGICERPDEGQATLCRRTCNLCPRELDGNHSDVITCVSNNIIILPKGCMEICYYFLYRRLFGSWAAKSYRRYHILNRHPVGLLKSGPHPSKLWRTLRLSVSCQQTHISWYQKQVFPSFWIILT